VPPIFTDSKEGTKYFKYIIKSHFKIDKRLLSDSLEGKVYCLQTAYLARHKIQSIFSVFLSKAMT